MDRLLKFNKVYFILAVLLFGIEILIAGFAHDQFIRPYAGDFLVVILIYCFVKSFLKTPVLPTALSVLLFSWLIEIMQYFNIITLLGLQHSEMTRIIMGTSFEWIDLIAYTTGIVFVLYAEKVMAGRNQKTKNQA